MWSSGCRPFSARACAPAHNEESTDSQGLPRAKSLQPNHRQQRDRTPIIDSFRFNFRSNFMQFCSVICNSLPATFYGFRFNCALIVTNVKFSENIFIIWFYVIFVVLLWYRPCIGSGNTIYPSIRDEIQVVSGWD